MDQEQKDLLNSVARELADKIDFIQIASHLKVAKLVPEYRIREIEVEASSNFHRNLKLLDALQDCSSLKVFEEFILILQLTNNIEALKLISLSTGEDNSRSARSICKDILAKMVNKFVRPKSLSTNPQYPLGMDSGRVAASPQQSTGAFPHYQGDSLVSPFKEKHQATLIGSGSSSSQSFNTNDSASVHGSQHGRAISSASNSLHADLNRLPATPPTTSYQNNNGGNSNSNYKLRGTRLALTNRASQTPVRPQELVNIHNLSISDDDDDDEHSGINGEPLVCWHPYAQPSLGNQDAHRASSPHYCHPSYASSSGSDTSSDSLIMDPNPLIQSSNVTMAIAKEGANVMKVKKASICRNNPEDDYKMTASPRGPCLIVNNIDFESEMFPTRKGSDEDARRFDQIFQDLGFTVIMRRNQTADQMRELFKTVAAECKPEHDALFVFILSHGSEHGIYGVDGMEVYLESEIISCFDNRNCRAMLGKPKVFVIQACRGRAKDCGGDGDMTDSIAWPSVIATPTGKSASQENRVPASWLPSSQPSDGKKRKHPIRTDMLLIFSCLAGFVSVRNELAGSWLGVALAYFIMTHAHERDLLKILYLVTSDVIQRESSHGHIQSIEVKLLGWTKNLYFNPGIPN